MAMIAALASTATAGQEADKFFSSSCSCSGTHSAAPGHIENTRAHQQGHPTCGFNQRLCDCLVSNQAQPTAPLQPITCSMYS